MVDVNLLVDITIQAIMLNKLSKDLEPGRGGVDETGRLEGLWAKIARHVRGGDFNIEVLKRGVVTAGGYLKSMGIEKAEIGGFEVESGMFGVEGLDRTSFF